MIDMESADEELRDIEDKIETLRDPSHVKNLSKQEMCSLFSTYGLKIEQCSTAEIEQKLIHWLNLTAAPEAVQQKITYQMQQEIDGGEKTGFSPYLTESGICFKQHWVLTLGCKIK